MRILYRTSDKQLVAAEVAEVYYNVEIDDSVTLSMDDVYYDGGWFEVRDLTKEEAEKFIMDIAVNGLLNLIDYEVVEVDRDGTSSEGEEDE